MTTTSIRVALIGYGYAGKTLHAPLITHTAGLELAVVASSRPAAVRGDHPAAEVMTTPLDAATRADVGLVVIAGPNATHAPLAEAALCAGKHVVVDKPFTVTLAEARALAELAAERGLLLSVFQNRRWDSDFLALHAALQAGRVARVTHFESRFDRFRPLVRDRWRERAGPGGGIWFDLGPHLVDQALQLFGLPQRVGGLFACQRDDAVAEDWFQVQLDYGRLQATLSASVLVGGGLPRFAVHGTGGSWLKHGLDVQEEQLKAGLAPGGPGWGVDPQPASHFPGDGTVVREAVAAGDYRIYYAAIGEAIRGRGANPVPPAQAVATMAVLETAAQAAREGRMRPLPLTEAERALFAASRTAG
jgi:predicted dehydrogenase